MKSLSILKLGIAFAGSLAQAEKMLELLDAETKRLDRLDLTFFEETYKKG